MQTRAQLVCIQVCLSDVAVRTTDSTLLFYTQVPGKLFGPVCRVSLPGGDRMVGHDVVSRRVPSGMVCK